MAQQPRNWQPVMLGADAKPPAGAYSPGVRAGRMLFVSGQIPRDPRTGEIVGTDIVTQQRSEFDLQTGTERVFRPPSPTPARATKPGSSERIDPYLQSRQSRGECSIVLGRCLCGSERGIGQALHAVGGWDANRLRLSTTPGRRREKS